DKGEQKELIRSVVDDLYQLNIHKHTTANERRLRLCYDLWGLLVTEPDVPHFKNGELLQELVVSQITGYVVEHFALAEDKERDICDFRFLADNLGGKVHRYDDECPLMPLAFLDWKKKLPKSVDVVTTHKKSAFDLACRVIHQDSGSFHKYIPILLQNAAVNFQSHGENDMVRKLGSFFGIETHQIIRSRSGRQDSVDLQDQQAMSGIDMWRRAKPDLCLTWSDVAMSWALQSSKHEIAIKSLEVFQRLKSYTVSYSLLIQLSLVLFVGLQKAYPFAVFDMVLDILESCVDQNQEWDKIQYRIAFALAYILLTLPYELIHKSSLNFLNKFMQLKWKYSTEQVIREMHSMFQFEYSSAGEGIAEMLKNSLVRKDLFDATGQFLDGLTTILAQDLRPHENEMFHLTILAHFIKIQLRALAQLNITFIFNFFFFFFSLFPRQQCFPKKKMDCRHLITILKCYEEKCQPMIRACEVVAANTNAEDFFVSIFREYFRLFGGDDRFTEVVMTLCKFLEYGSPLWHEGILRLLDIVISVSTRDISADLFKQIADVLITTSFLAESHNLVNIISEVGYRLVKRTNKTLPEKRFIFEFTQPTESLRRRIQYARTPNKHRFGSGGIDADQRLHELCVQRMQKHLFPYLDDAVRQEKAPKHMKSCSSLDLRSASFASPKVATTRSFPTTVLNKAELDTLPNSRPSVVMNLDVPTSLTQNTALAITSNSIHSQEYRKKIVTTQILEGGDEKDYDEHEDNEEDDDDDIDDDDDDDEEDDEDAKEEHSYASEHSRSVHIKDSDAHTPSFMSGKVATKTCKLYAYMHLFVHRNRKSREKKIWNILWSVYKQLYIVMQR
ncbi:hypothetical protein RFI_06567, partial [Reticulomyxa filosa]